jgi:glutamate/aspartate transport system permease protein
MSMLDFQWVLNSREIILEGLKTTAIVTAWAIVMGLSLGSLVAMCRTSSNKALRVLGMLYINGFRMQALLVVLSGVYLIALAALRKHGIYADIALPAALIAFGLFEAAYFAEILRTGINAVDPGQGAACQALGMGKWQAYRLVVLPQAVKNALPSIVIQCITIFQDSTLVYVVGLSDFFAVSLHLGERDSNTEGAIVFVAISYLLMSLALRRLTKGITGGKRQ